MYTTGFSGPFSGHDRYSRGQEQQRGKRRGHEVIIF